jgi:hypothetical protein
MWSSDADASVFPYFKKAIAVTIQYDPRGSASNVGLLDPRAVLCHHKMLLPVSAIL